MTIFHPDTPKKCPPKDAVPSSEIYYRIIYNNPPTADDFRLWIHMPENAHKLDERKKKNDCNAFAISMLKEKGVSRAVKMFQHAISRRSKKNQTDFLGVAHVRLDLSSGVLKQTGRNPYHYDLWPYLDSKLEHNVVAVKPVRGM